MDLYGELGEDDLFRDVGNKFPRPRMFANQGSGDQSAKSDAPTAIAIVQ